MQWEQTIYCISGLGTDEQVFRNISIPGMRLTHLQWLNHDHILRWKNDWYPEGTVHIHGEMDKMFPVRNISTSHVIGSGTHMMIYNRSKEINEFLHHHLKFP
jgi:hypothetical protein